MTNPTNRPLSLFPAPMLEPDHYAQVTPDMMPPLADVSDEDAHAMAMQYADEQSDDMSHDEMASTDPQQDEDEDENEPDEPDCDDGDDYYIDHDVYGGGMIGGDSDLLGEW